MVKSENSNRAASHKAIATYAVIDRDGKRIGTHHVHRPEQIESVLKAKHFRWINSAARREWLAWRKRHKGEQA